MMVYELIDTDGFNVIGAYDSEAEALAVLRDLVAINGFNYVQTVSLMTSGGSRQAQVIATGHELARRADIVLESIVR